ncbi:O-antigen polysaccharide polymerase Wzy [Winogradskyella pacifica]|uniref:O-antigen polysaccharide polymerase Wzy n=1 Tax=Winogradskyella pacifica TaxID=664642 RepID=UPI0015CC1324|nr:O-antigen polysaccharide polymerase Wzy [Winogradskyella pacifica]
MKLINNLIKSKTWNIVISMVLFAVLVSNDVNLFSAIGLALTLFSFLLYIRKLGDNLPILELMLLLCGYQWIVASYYSFLNGDTFYPMEVDETTYMSITVLLYAGLLIGVLLVAKSIKISKENLERHMSIGKNRKFILIIISVGFVAILVKPIIPMSLLFVNHLLASMLYVGGLMILYSNFKYKWFVFFVIFGSLFLRVIIIGVFNEFLSWGFFIVMFLANIFKPSKAKIIMFLLASVMLISVLQAVKPYYRSIIWEGYQGNKIALFFEIFIDNLTGQFDETNLDESELYDNLNSRANQGWVYSMVYSHVPSNVPYARGSTILAAISDSFLPRFLFPNKAPTFSKDLFEKYTGRQLGDNTAMGLGILGEGYANFGKFGAFLFMMVYGMIIGWIVKVYNRKSMLLPVMLFFVPVYFEMIIRAISNLSQVINWQVKVTFLFWLLFRYYRSNYYEMPNKELNILK